MAKGIKTGGRKPGSANKITLEIKALAQQHAATAITELARLMKNADSEAARVAAIKELLDRAYGKSPQAMTGDGGGPVQHAIKISWMTEAEANESRGWGRS